MSCGTFNIILEICVEKSVLTALETQVYYAMPTRILRITKVPCLANLIETMDYA